MGKNNKLINQINALAMKHHEKNVKEVTDEITAQFYAAMGLALHRSFGFGLDELEKALNTTLEIWHEHKGRGEELTKKFEEELGIKITKD